ncbi:MAG: HAD-IA family hydrolase, partial [SAR202 cluster bacterium]|nr:HAD-IA family hydrolase [SAR202 cluster bacterium]
DRFMRVWQNLRPYEDSVRGLDRLQGKYRLVALSNGEPWFLKHLADNRIKFEFHRIISVEEAGYFKPHPSVYRTAARLLDSEPSEILMVAAHAFDIMGARASGYRGAYVNRYGLPYEDTTQYKPDMVVDDFDGLANALLDG